jgi:methyl-accepting chemotaxis protein
MKDVEKISIDIGEIVKFNQGMKDSGQEISAGVTQAQKGLEQIATANEQASSNCQQALVAAEQQSRGMELLAKSIEEIASVADEMQNG